MMDEKMRLLIAYDGSACANEALDDLGRAGLPPEIEAHVVAVSEEWLPDFGEEHHTHDWGTVVTTQRRTRSGAALEQARQFAEIAVRRLQKRFPDWTISTFVNADSPAFGLLSAADLIEPDLIVVGSHGRTALGRLILGSVSQKVLAEASCSVRIARYHPAVEGSPVRIVLGVDGTPDSDAAVEVVASRNWPKGSTVLAVAAHGLVDVEVPPLGAPATLPLSERIDEHWQILNRVTEEAASRLRAAGLVARAEVKDGAPIPVLIDTAREWGADGIFLGARGHRFLERFLLGSVSAAVAARAGCSVEVIRIIK
jgi:nucleotide-binding universal stress UspA family protein